MGLSAKNAILIVEFAMEAHLKGKSVFDSAVEAARLRFRPICMTSLAFCLGIFPLVIATGAGAASRHALGTGLVGGMIAASTLAIIFVPLFFYILEMFSERYLSRIAVFFGASIKRAAQKTGAKMGNGIKKIGRKKDE